MPEKTAERKGNVLTDIAIAIVMMIGFVLWAIYSLLASIIRGIFGLF